MKVIAKSLTNVKVEVQSGRHKFIADEPAGVGDDAGPDPCALLLRALGACKVMTVMMYARRKGWQLNHVEVRLETNNQWH